MSIVGLSGKHGEIMKFVFLIFVCPNMSIFMIHGMAIGSSIWLFPWIMESSVDFTLSRSYLVGITGRY